MNSFDENDIAAGEEITANYKYVYDPGHEKRPEGSNWRRTSSGWSRGISEEEHGGSSHSSESSSRENAGASGEGDKGVSHEMKERRHPEKEPNLDSADDSHGQEDESKLDDSLDDGVFEEIDKVPEEQEEGGNADVPVVLEEESPDAEESVPSEEEKEPDADGGEELSEAETDEESSADEAGEADPFSESKTDEYLDDATFDDRVAKMNEFVSAFDNSEGRENKITFKAVASNLDWSNLNDVRTFSDYCTEKGMESAEDILAFLYHQHNADEVQFEKIVDMME